MRGGREKPGLPGKQKVGGNRWATLRMILVGAVLLIAVIRVPPQALKSFGGSRSDGFDYYVLALSWSPSFCATHRDPHQCSGDAGFVLHGLWPQYQGKGYPADCKTTPLTEPQRRRGPLPKPFPDRS